VLLIDLSDVTFVDSATLGVFVYAGQRVGPLGGRMVVLSPDTGLRRLFALVGLEHLFAVVPGADAVPAAIAAGAPPPTP
jgi:anti-sigma B factor antagonist